MLETAFRIGDRLGGRFVVRSFDGRGPLGERYLALDEEVEVDVELRVVHATLLPEPELRRTFVERMQRSRALAHQNFLRVHDVFEDNAHAVLAVQHATGQLLSSWMDGGRLTPFAEVRPVLGKIASALAHAHQVGIVLGDLRPATVLILGGAGSVASAAVKVSSVGVALALPRDRYLSVASTQPDFEYLSPELRAGSPCDARTDVYSLAALVGAVLFGGQLLRGDAIANSGISGAADLGPVLVRGLESDPARRFPTVEAFLTAVDRAAERARRREGPAIVPLPGSVASLSLDGTARRLPRSVEAAPEPEPAGVYSAALMAEARTAAQAAPAASASPAALAAPPTRGGGGGGDITRMVDEDELRRLAGEINDILETTRQISVEEIDGLRARSAAAPDQYDTGPDSGRLVLGPSPARRATGAIPVVRPDDDLSFDFDTRPDDANATRVEGPARRRESSVADRMPREPAARDAGGRAYPARSDAQTVAEDRATEITVLAALGTPPPLVEPASEAEEAFSNLDADTQEAAPAELFSPEQDPFAAAIEAHSSQSMRAVTPATLEEIDDDAQTRAIRVPPPSAPPNDPAGVDDEPPHLLERSLRSPNPPAFEAPRSSLNDFAGGAEDTSSLRRPGREASRPIPLVTPSASAPDSVRVIAPPLPAPVRPALSPALARARTAPAQANSSTARTLLLIVVGLAFVVLALGVFAFVARRTPPSPLSVDAPEPPAIVAAVPRSTPELPSVATADKAAPPVAQPVVTAMAAPADAAPEAAPIADPPPGADAAGCAAGMVRVRSLRPFCVDIYEYPGQGQLPRTALGRDEAARLCAARGARLCGDKEWESACRGNGSASYPYGATYQAEVCNTVEGTVKPAGSLPACRSRVGAFDMSGNVAEWTAEGTVHGGAAGEGNPAARCSHDVRGVTSGAKVGFRCCADVK